MSDGENSGSLAGLWNLARRFLPAGARSGDRGQPGGSIHPSRTLRPFVHALSGRPSPVLVDLGPALGTNVSFLGAHLACKLYPEDLYFDLDQPFERNGSGTMTAVFETKLRQEANGVDGILAWDVFDHLNREEAGVLAGKLTALLRPGGLLMALFTTEPRDDTASRRYVIVDEDHLMHRPAPGARWPRRVWPLGDIERLLAPLEVVESHLLAHHQREMLLRKPPARGKEG